MRRLLMVLLSLILLLAGCGGVMPHDVTAKTGTEFQLPVGQTAWVKAANLYITFNAVLGDSRCPQGAQCITAGHVTVRLSLKDDAGSGEIEVQLLDQAAAAWQGHRFTVRVAPYPVVDQQVDPASYYLILNVSE